MLAFPSIRSKCSIHNLSLLSALRALPRIRPHRSLAHVRGLCGAVSCAISVIGTARTAVMRLCGTRLWPAVSAAAQRSGSAGLLGPLVVGIRDRMLS